MVQWTLGLCAVCAVEDVVRSTAVQHFVALDDAALVPLAVSLAAPCNLCSTIICMSFCIAASSSAKQDTALYRSTCVKALCRLTFFAVVQLRNQAIK